MKNLFKMIALIFGLGQSQSIPQQNDNSYSYETGTFLFGKKVEFIEGVGYRENANINLLTKTDFINHMRSKNVICL